MSNKSGYTLIELLAIITVLSIVIITIVVFANNIINNSLIKMDKVTENSIIDAAVNFSVEYRSNDWWKEDVNDETGDVSYCVSLNTLLDYGYFDNFDNNYDKWKDTYIVDVSIVNGVYDYKLKKIEDSNCVYVDFYSNIKENEVNYKIKDDSNIEVGKFDYDIRKIKDKEYSFGYKLDLDLVSIVEDIYVTLIVDRSDSMVHRYSGDEEYDYPQKYRNAKTAAINFSKKIIQEFSGNSYVSLIQYDEKVILNRDFQTNALKDNNFYATGSGTNLSGALDLAISLMCRNGLDIDPSDSKWCSDIYSGEEKNKNIKLYTILFFDGDSTYASYIKYNGSDLYKTNIINDDKKKYNYFKNFWTNSGSIKNLNVRDKTENYILDNYLKYSAEYLKNDLDVDLFMIGYDFASVSNLKKLSTSDEYLCKGGYSVDGQNYCFYDANVGNVDIVLDNILGNIIINNQIVSVKFNLKPKKNNGNDMITLLNEDGSNVDNNILEIKYNDLESFKEDFSDSVSDYKILINDFMYSSCFEFDENNQCDLNNIKLFDVTLDIGYKNGSSNSISIDTPEFDLSLINVNTLN